MVSFSLRILEATHGVSLTVTTNTAFFLPYFAVIFAFPARRATILPFLLTVTMALLLEDHLTLLAVLTLRVFYWPAFRVTLVVFVLEAACTGATISSIAAKTTIIIVTILFALVIIILLSLFYFL